MDAPAHGGLTLGERLRLQRERRDLSRFDLGRMAGMSSRTIGRYERDEKEPVAHVLGRMALALNTTADYLIGLRDDPTVPPPDSITRVWLNAAA
jgi:transcriptional regulator with XRE-family HTH domain